MPVLQNTELGWVVAGNLCLTNCNQVSSINHFLTEDYELINNEISKFWMIEDIVNRNKIMSEEEKHCESYFKETTKRDDLTGKFIVKIPFKTSVTLLGDFRETAMKRFFSLEKKFMKNTSFRDDYSAIMKEYENLLHMSEIVDDKPDENEYFLPHHAVFKASSVTTKCCVVFDASAKTNSGLSLNDTQYVGPVLQKDLFSILLNFRIYLYGFTADISKMYRMVLIDPDQRRFQKIFWRTDPNENMKIYQLNTVTFGTSSAPYLSIKCLMQLAEENNDKFPLASKVIAENFYVDDLLTGADSVAELLKIQREVSMILSSAGFELRKWLCNEPTLIEKFSINPYLQASVLEIGNESNKTLGVYWNPSADEICYKICEFENDTLAITKRKMLSIICQIFDPLGLVGPVIIIAKIFMQELWKLKIDWDQNIPHDIFVNWLKFQRELAQLNILKIPRCSVIFNRKSIELHGFSDASEKAYGVSIYIRSVDSNGNILSNILCAKSRVAPLKQISVPRLELCGALLLANLVDKVIQSFEIDFTHRYYWTDSKITLSWIKGDATKWKTFVANRVTEINSLTNINDWHYVKSNENPGDIISRGMYPESLLKSKLWWNGPSWLLKKEITWTDENAESSFDIPEQKNIVTSLIISSDSNFIIDLISRYSSFQRLQKVLAYILRFIKSCREQQKQIGPLNPEELEISSVILIKIVQIESFPEDYKNLFSEKMLSRKSKILPLNPFIHDSLIRVGGRIKNNKNLSFGEKHQILLPNRHKLTNLILINEHERLMHCGVQQLLFSIRQRFWLLSARNACKKIVKGCVHCVKAKPKELTYIMGNLPECRVNCSFPFQNVGIDYGGPFAIKDRKLRGAKIIKGYVCLFICMSIKAVHLELVTDLTTESFLAVLKRFMSRRGKPSNIYSDNGSNFVGANNDIEKVFSFLTKENDFISNKLVEEKIKWHFIPARSPTFGGIWEAGIKSMKFHLKRVLGNNAFTYEDFSTVLVQIEGILNSRPLCPISSDLEDLTALTPAHFLIGRPFTEFPESDIKHVPENRLKRFQHLQYVVQHLWIRWQREYLNELQTRVKWRENSNHLLKVGSLVLMKNEQAPTSTWQLGRVTSLYPGSDNVVRVVDIKVQNGVFRRAVTKICVLPIDA